MNMQYQGIILFLILLPKFCLTEESGYKCSDFHNAAGKFLEECPLAKFMLVENLVECYDNASRFGEIKSRSIIISFFFFRTYFVSRSSRIHQKTNKINFLDGNSNKYWCWSRHDVSEDIIKDTIISAAVDDQELTDLMKQPFSVRYLSNETHYKCDSSKEWANAWYVISGDNISPCVTNTSVAINVKFKANDDKL